MVSKDQITFWKSCRDHEYYRVKKELEDGMNPNFFYQGITPLMAASDFQNRYTARLASTTKLLLDHGADPNAAGYLGETILMRVAKYTVNPDISKILILELILFGADVTATDDYGVGVINHALRASSETKSILLYLLEQGANINEYFDYCVKRSNCSSIMFYELVEKFQDGLNEENQIKWKTVRLKSIFR